MTVRLMWLSNALLVAGCAGEAAPAASPSSPPQPSSSPSAHVDPAPPSTAPVDAAAPADGFSLRYHGLSAQVSLAPASCVLFSVLGDAALRCSTPFPQVSHGVSAWLGRDQRGIVVFLLQESLEDTPRVPALPPSLTDKAMDASTNGVNNQTRQHGFTVARVRAKELRARMPDGSERFMLILAPANEPTTRAGKGIAHQALVQIPTKRALYTLTWATSAERADEIEAMARKTFESVRFEEP